MNFFSVNNVLREYDAMKETIKNLKRAWVSILEIGQCPVKNPVMFNKSYLTVVCHEVKKNYKFSTTQKHQVSIDTTTASSF